MTFFHPCHRKVARQPSTVAGRRRHLALTPCNPDLGASHGGVGEDRCWLQAGEAGGRRSHGRGGNRAQGLCVTDQAQRPWRHSQADLHAHTSRGVLGEVGAVLHNGHHEGLHRVEPTVTNPSAPQLSRSTPSEDARHRTRQGRLTPGRGTGATGVAIGEEPGQLGCVCI
jgi:hypothetical protein